MLNRTDPYRKKANNWVGVAILSELEVLSHKDGVAIDHKSKY